MLLKPHDIIGFIGGANMVGIQESGHFEARVLARFPDHGLRFRNLAWEGDTVFAQPRDFNFPSLTNLLRRFDVTFLIVGFGQAECLQSTQHLGGFLAAYDRLLTGLQRQVPRVALATLFPFEKPTGGYPDLSLRNPVARSYSQGIRELAARRGLPVVDLFQALEERATVENAPRLTENGMHLTPRGQAVVAAVMAGEMGAAARGDADPADVDGRGGWTGAMESLRRAVVAKNRLWFDYWRPMNWAFLNGDRTEQPSSRDHLNPGVRWFPAEMEKFVPLLYRAESDIDRLAASLHPSHP